MSRRHPRVLAPDLTYSERDRDELVEFAADEQILRFAYAVEKRAALGIALDRLAGVVKNHAHFATAALHQAFSERSPIATSPEVTRHALTQLTKDAETDGESAAALIAIVNRAEILSREMIRLAASD